jgi:hypothetical protein
MATGQFAVYGFMASTTAAIEKTTAAISMICAISRVAGMATAKIRVCAQRTKLA